MLPGSLHVFLTRIQSDNQSRYDGFMLARITVSTDEGVALDMSLGNQPLSIGRAKDNVLRSDDRRTSRRHAALRRLDDGRFEVEDLGSSYGTFLNGRLIKKETLQHRDLIRCGGFSLQFVEDHHHTSSDDADPSIMTATLDNLFDARAEIRRLIDEAALLRQEVGIAQQAEDRAQTLRDEAQDEVERLHKIIDNQRKELAILHERTAQLGTELRDKLSSKSDISVDAEALQKQLAETQKLAERHKNHAIELEQRDLTRAASEQALRKETERLQEQVKQREAREQQLSAALKPAILRIAELSREVEQLRLRLATAEADLADAKQR